MNISQIVINPLVWKGLKLLKMERIFQAVTYVASAGLLKDNTLSQKSGFEESYTMFLRNNNTKSNWEPLNIIFVRQ